MKKNILILISSFLILYSSLHAQWSVLGGQNGLGVSGLTLCSDASGNIYAGGFAYNYSGSQNVANWNGTAWSELGELDGLGDNRAFSSLCTDASGNIYIGGGYFVNNSSKLYVAKWNGTAWSELGGLNGLAAYTHGGVLSVCSDASGNIYAGGGFGNSSGYFIAKWNGTTWSELGGQNGLEASSIILSLCNDALGNIYAGGFFSNSSGNQYVAIWDGTAWSELGGLNGLMDVYSLDIYSINSICSDALGNIYAGGNFTNQNYNGYVAKWDGTAWSELGGPNTFNDPPLSICSDGSGNIYAGGRFTNSSGFHYVAKWDGTAWSEVGGLNGLAANNAITSVCSDPSGNIYAGGNFYDSFGNTYVTKYNVITGTESVSGEAWEMNIFPNPAKNEIHISQNNMAGENNLFFTLVDLQGRNVLVQLFQSSKPIDVSTLPEGLYIATLKGKEKEVSGKVMIKR